MGKLSRQNQTTALAKGPTGTTGQTRTHEGGKGYAKDLKTELYTLALTNFVSEDTFYESARDRDERFNKLVTENALADPTWTAGLIGWMRGEGNMRTASLVAAAEYAAAGAPNARAVVASACQRADEPGELLSYWRGTHGRKIPFAVKRGLADAATRLYGERSFVKYGASHPGFTMADVVEMVHPKPRDHRQASLFRYMLDVRHGRDNPRLDESLTDTAQLAFWRAHPDINKTPALLTWEVASSYVKPDAAFWERMIPKMGYMALLRNLRNFSEAGISKAAEAAVAEKLADPDEVAQSRQFPFRFWAAHKHSGSLRFSTAIEEALDHSVANLSFGGRTAILIDTSGSMEGTMSGKSKLQRVEAAAVFGAAVYGACEKSTLAIFADVAGKLDRLPTSTLLRAQAVISSVGRVGHGTQIWPSVASVWNKEGPFDRIMVFTDMQAHPTHQIVDMMIPKHVPVYVWDLAGYAPSVIEPGRGRYLLGGLSDASFKLIPLLEAGSDAGWPWE